MSANTEQAAATTAEPSSTVRRDPPVMFAPMTVEAATNLPFNLLNGYLALCEKYAADQYAKYMTDEVFTLSSARNILDADGNVLCSLYDDTAHVTTREGTSVELLGYVIRPSGFAKTPPTIYRRWHEAAREIEGYVRQAVHEWRHCFSFLQIPDRVLMAEAWWKYAQGYAQHSVGNEIYQREIRVTPQMCFTPNNVTPGHVLPRRGETGTTGTAKVEREYHPISDERASLNGMATARESKAWESKILNENAAVRLEKMRNRSFPNRGDAARGPVGGKIDTSA